MVQLPGEDANLFTRTVTNQVIEGFLNVFEIDDSGEIELESFRNFCKASNLLKKFIEDFPEEGVNFLRICYEEMYVMLTDTEYAFSFSMFGQFLLNEMVEIVQDEVAAFDNMEMDDAQIAQMVGDMVFSEHWNTTRGTDLIRVVEYFTARSKKVFSPLTEEKEDARNAWIREKTAVYTDFRRMGMWDDEGCRILFDEGENSFYAHGWEGYSEETIWELQKNLSSGSRKIYDLDDES